PLRSGCAAVSPPERFMSNHRAPDGSNRRPWAWLDPYQPVDRVGHGAILLYYIPKWREKAKLKSASQVPTARSALESSDRASSGRVHLASFQGRKSDRRSWARAQDK